MKKADKPNIVININVYGDNNSVVYNGSTFGQEKQENDKSARIPTLLDFFSSCKRNG